MFPAATIKGCQFHLGQARRRQIQKFGLAPLYKDNESFLERGWRNVLIYLHCPLRKLKTVLLFLYVLIYRMISNVSKFEDYRFHTYSRQDSMFPPLMWTYTIDETKRTNSGCESFPRHFAQQFSNCRPNIFESLEKKIEEHSRAGQNWK